MNVSTRTDARPHPPYVWMAVAALGTGTGIALTLTNPAVPGSEALSVEDVVDAVCMLLFGLLGAVLLERGIAHGLGRALLLLGVLIGVDYLLAGIGDAVAQGLAAPPAAARLAYLGGEAAFVGTFFLLLYAPLTLFPTGRVPSRRWRWAPWVCGLGACTAVTALLLTPGPVDDDVPAWGDNPLGVDALADAAGALETLATVLLAGTLATGLAAFVARWVRYRGLRRRQLAWFSAGVLALVVGFVTDIGGSELVEVVMALVIFGSLFAGIAWPLLGPLGRAAALEDETDRVPARSERPPDRLPSAGPAGRQAP
jgi:hypothetical protein